MAQCIICGRVFGDERQFRAHLMAELAIETGVASLRSYEGDADADETKKETDLDNPVLPGMFDQVEHIVEEDDNGFD